MKIKEITLQGFKGISTKVNIPIAPITLLFGANSTGKSTVLHSLLYLYEILANNDTNPQYSSLTGDKVYLGGFENLVHGKSNSNSIVIGVSLDFSDSEELWEDFIMLGEQFLLETAIGGTPASTCNAWSFELEIAWSSLDKKPFIKRYQTYSDGESFCQIDYKPGTPESVISEFRLLPEWEILESFETVKQWEDPSGWSPVSVNLGRTALPDWRKRIDLSNSGLNLEDISPEHPLAGLIFLEGCASQALLAPIKILLKKLHRLVHVGPLRIIPDLNFVNSHSLSNKDWFNGTGAWNKFIAAPEDLKQRVNDWFNHDKGFATGYQIKASKDQFGRSLPYLVEQSSQTNLSFGEVGVGLSQVAPFVIGCCDDSIPMLSFEQPELHIHPKWQLALADMLTEAVNNDSDRLFFIETHSEHLMLRLLNRIRLNSGEDEYQVQFSVANDKVSVINVYLHEGEVYYQQQTVTKDGDFELDWPEGFFEERYGE
jgi:predicted ATPase